MSRTARDDRGGETQTILAIGTHGSDDPTRAAMPLVTAQGTVESGHRARVALLGEAAYLLLPGVADEMVAVAFGNLGERLRSLAEWEVPVYV